MDSETKTTGAEARNDVTLDIRLIPEFDGASQDVVEWLEKLELICRIRGIHGLHNVLPLRLTGGAFAVYMQLPATDKVSYTKLKESLISAFSTDKFLAYEQFITRKIRIDESADVYLADLRRLATLIGGMTDSALTCAFVAGLPESTKRVLRAGSRIENMDLSQVLCRTRAVLAGETQQSVASVTEKCVSSHNTKSPPPVICFKCGQPNHLARNCLVSKESHSVGGSRVQIRRQERHRHSGNDLGEVDSAPLASPSLQQ